MAQSFTPTDPWVLARSRYMEDLDEDEQKIFATASLENLFYTASVAQKEHEAESKSRAISSMLEPFVTAIDQYGSALDVVSNTYSLAMAPLWGSIRVLLHVAKAFEKYFQKLIEMLTRIGDVLRRCRVYQSLFPSHARLLQSISIAYLDIIHFCTDAKKTFRKLKKSTTVHFALKLFWKDFAGDFEGTLNKFRNHIKNVEKEVGIASMIEGSEERALAREDRTERDKQRQVAERDLLLSKLSSIGYIEKHLRERRKRHPGSGSWLKETVECKNWMVADRSACLWCYGIPGSGKTILASGLIDTLSMDEANKDITIQPLTSYEILSKGITQQELIITYYYCDSSNPRSLEAWNILGTIIKELLEQIAITDVLKQQLVSLNRPGIRVAESNELIPILLAVLKHFTKAYIFLDGLDECRKEERVTILSAINELVSCGCPVVKVFVTSQQEVDIAAALERFPHLEISADRISSDIGCFIKETVRSCIQSGSMIVQTAGLESDIISALVDGAQGMFLWVSFQVEDLCDATSDYEIKETLQNLPKGMGATYARILQKISSVRTNMSLAQRVFKWIICAKRPLLITELTEAIAFQPTDRSWNAEKIPDASRTIQACKNLVVLDETDQTVRLAHHSVRKFLLEPSTQDSIPEFHFELNQASTEAGELCIAYLSFSDFERQLTTSTHNIRLLTGEVPGPSAILDSVRSSPTSGHATSGLIKLRKRMSKCDTAKQPSSLEFANLVKLRKTAPPSLLEKYAFLKYAVENWIGHTSNLPDHDKRLWSLFKDLAMDKPMPFDIRVWGDMHGSNGLPYTALFRWAVNAGHVPLLKLLLELPKGSDLHAYCLQEESEGSSVGFNAAICSHANVIELLEQIGYIKIQSGASLVEAAKKGQLRVVRVLLVKAAKKGKVEAVRDLLDYDPCPEGNLEALYGAARAGHGVLAGLLLDSMPNTNMKNKWLRLTLSIAIANGWDEILVLMLRKATSIKGALDTLKHNLPGDVLTEAAQRGLAGVVTILLENGADVTRRDQDGRTAMYWAAYNGHLEVVRVLLYNRIKPKENSQGLWSAMDAVARQGGKQIMELLIEDLIGTDGGVKQFVCLGAELMETAVEHGQEEIVLLLLENGVDINSKGQWFGETALNLAASMGDAMIVQLLLDRGAATEISTNGGLIDCRLAARTELELNTGLPLAKDAHANAQRTSEGKKTALHTSVIEGHTSLVQLLLEHGADIMATTTHQSTALHLAITNGREDIVELLVERGADINASDLFCKTPLEIAVDKGHENIVHLLKSKAP